MQDVRRQDVRKILAAAMLAPASLSELSEAGIRASRHSRIEERPALPCRLRAVPAVTLLALAAASAAGTASAATAIEYGLIAAFFGR